MKKALLLILLLPGSTAISGQDPVLMRINGKDILRSEFQHAYHRQKNLTPRTSPKEYAEVFALDQLKIANAQAQGIDTTAHFLQEAENCRRRLIRPYLTDEATATEIARQEYQELITRQRGEAWQVAHLFKQLPQNITNRALNAAEARMDSLYAALQQGGNFEEYLLKFSDQKRPFRLMRLQATTEFEEAVLALNVGAYSKPFFTPEGIHIVKLIAKEEAPPFEQIKDQLIEKQVRHYDTDKATDAQVEKLKTAYHYTPHKAGMDDLLFKGHTAQSLFALDGKVYTGSDFARFAATHVAGLQKQLDRFIAKTVLDHENAHLEQKHHALHQQMQIARDSLLLDIITTQQVASQPIDDASLKAHFEAHRTHYNWKEPRYKGIVLHCTTKSIAKKVRKFLKEVPEEEWLNAIRLTFNATSPVQVQALQGTFAPGNNAYIDRKAFKGKKVPPIESFPFTTIIGRKQKGPESYHEVKQQLIEDRKKWLETSWISRLKTAGKVEINQEVLKTVNNH